ncbi:MAG: hypothetical protein ACYDHP_12345 [Ferrimicrobium sp.]
MGGPRTTAAVGAFVDANDLIWHLTGEQSEIATPATVYLVVDLELLLTELVTDENISVFESYYEVLREKAAEVVHSPLWPHPVITVIPVLLLRASTPCMTVA